MNGLMITAPAGHVKLNEKNDAYELVLWGNVGVERFSEVEQAAKTIRRNQKPITIIMMEPAAGEFALGTSALGVLANLKAHLHVGMWFRMDRLSEVSRENVEFLLEHTGNEHLLHASPVPANQRLSEEPVLIHESVEENLECFAGAAEEAEKLQVQVARPIRRPKTFVSTNV